MSCSGYSNQLPICDHMAVHPVYCIVYILPYPCFNFQNHLLCYGQCVINLRFLQRGYSFDHFCERLPMDWSHLSTAIFLVAHINDPLTLTHCMYCFNFQYFPMSCWNWQWFPHWSFHWLYQYHMQTIPNQKYTHYNVQTVFPSCKYLLGNTVSPLFLLPQYF